MKDGYIRVAAGSFDTTIANVTNNSNNIKQLIGQAYQNQAKILVLPELCLTGYTCEDLFNQERLLNEAKNQLQQIVKYTENKDIVVIVGLPYQHLNCLYNVAAVIHQGKLLAMVPKTHIPNYQEFYEARRFEPAPKKNLIIDFFGNQVPFGTKYIFASTTNENFRFGIEICEDLWLPDSPSINLALNGANIILNPSASNEITTKSDYRRSLVTIQSAKLVCGYVYCNAGDGESTTDVVFSGHHLICENGTIINESHGFESELIYGDLDLKKLASERRKMTTYKTRHDYEMIYFESTDIDLDTTYYYDPHPFVPSNHSLRAKRCKEVFDIQTRALMQRLKATGIKKVVIGISGGLDSTLALLVCTMAFQKLNYDSKDIIAITMPCFGTTSRTKNNALGLMDELNVTSLEIDITKSVRVQFADIDQDENNHDVTYENVQARTRTEILMNKANQVGGLVIGTGDLSEVALGWSTYNGDHMSMYAVNVSVPKTLVRYLVDYVASLYKGQKIETILKDVLDTPVSPELLPQENDQIVQKTEDIVGPYELHDFFIYHMVRFGDEPRKLFRKTKIAFKDKYDDETIKKWLTKFYWRFFTQQFKRSCIPDGPKVGTVSLSPRGDWRMPSDSDVRDWIREIEKI
ncbi:NAD(+) synthase [uncultured Thomasclavelia sp.]|uniref:NAD(+) synthase n=1 Tax=uncultured Thomasclavelia sp. TaxID=3025759 RepID=UPI0025CD0F20|nr:NAD(+) synthase [uncultured Thomasclavelia sp.]